MFPQPTAAEASIAWVPLTTMSTTSKMFSKTDETTSTHSDLLPSEKRNGAPESKMRRSVVRLPVLQEWIAVLRRIVDPGCSVALGLGLRADVRAILSEDCYEIMNKASIIEFQIGISGEVHNFLLFAFLSCTLSVL